MQTQQLLTFAALSSLLCAAACGPDVDADANETGSLSSALSKVLENDVLFENPTGSSSSFSTAGSVDLTGSFFQVLGTNGRTCNTCHLASDGWTVAASSAQRTFDATDGNDPLFAFDGQNCRGADRSTTAARRAASSLMIDKALVRLDKAFPADGEIEIVAAEGTYCNVTDSLNHVVFRRPLPTVNFGALGTSTWDGFGNVIAPTALDAVPMIFVGATMIHAQGAVFPTNAQIADGTAMMMSLTNAQAIDLDANDLTSRGARGGAENLASASLTGAPGFTIYDAWRTATGGNGTQLARRAVARGQDLFNARCASCHSVPNQGNQSTFRTIVTGTSDAAHRTPDLPLYTLRNKITGETTQTSDAGAALNTGRWADIGKFKVPMLRGLAARAPYFHNGMAATLDDVVEFYDDRFHMGLNDQAKDDLVAFLKAL
jgi:hypothetical protein